MAPNAPPNDVRFAGNPLRAVLKGRAAVPGPGHLEDAAMPLHAFRPQTRAEGLVRAQIRDQVSDRFEKLEGVSQPGK
jgi:hypothetical protein